MEGIHHNDQNLWVLEAHCKWHSISTTILKQMQFLYFIMILICLFDSETWLIAYDFIKQNSQHGKINLISIFFISAAHTVLNNTISTQILQDKSFKYYLIHNIISDST